MKMFWEILGVKKKLYTGQAVKYIIDSETGEKYYTGEGKLYKKKDYPKKLAENIFDVKQARFRYDFYYGVAVKRQPDRVEKTGLFGKERHVYYSVSPKDLEKEYMDRFGLWKIKGLNMYTDKAVDIIRDKRTGREYFRGDRKIFRNEDETPFPLVEHTNDYEFIYVMDGEGVLSSDDYLREIYAGSLIGSLFGKKYRR